MDIEALAEDLFGIVKAAAPLVGLGDEVAAAEALLKSAKGAYDKIKDAIDPAKASQLGASLDDLATVVNAHADRTAASLG